ncbi:hypothetical protein ACFL1H_03285 [Nanoarchaeota archaeon]
MDKKYKILIITSILIVLILTILFIFILKDRPPSQEELERELFENFFNETLGEDEIIDDVIKNQSPIQEENIIEEITQEGEIIEE